MPGPSIQELLGLPSDVTRPNAYQVFGLELGESDRSVIDTAIQQRIAALKQAKANASPDTWKRAAIAVQTAQRTLKDPIAKADLDASYGIISGPIPGQAESSAHPAGNPAANADPLASLLPPSTAALPPTAMPAAMTTSQPATQPITPAIQTGPDVTQRFESVPAVKLGGDGSLGGSGNLGSSGVGSLAGKAAAPVIRVRKPARRRRSWSGLVFGALLMAMMASLVGGLGYAYLLGPGQVQIVQTEDGFQIKTGGGSNGSTAVAAPRAVEPNPQAPLSSVMKSNTMKSDGIMRLPVRNTPGPGNSLANDLMRESATMSMPASTGNAVSPNDMPPNDMAPNTIPPGTSAVNDAKPAMGTDPMAAGPTVADSMVTEPAPTPSQPSMSPESISIANVAIAKARDAIKTANWEMMKPLAEMAESMAVTPDQKQLAETIYQYADLATFYRGAILLAVPALPINSEIKITDTLSVMVNEADAEHLKINRGKDASGKPQYREYLIDEIPLILVRAIAPYQLDVESPEGKAAQAAYQAIWPGATAGVREESIQIFRSLSKVDGADPKRLAEFLSTLTQ